MASDRTPHAFPRFDSVEDERRHRKQRLAAALRLFGAFGFDEGAAGHITARDPELTDHFWVNPLAMSFKQMRVRDLLLVNSEGEVVEGTWPVNKAAFIIHSHVHEARPEVVGAAHSHSPYGKAWSALRRPLLPVTQDACAFYGDHAVYDDYGGVAFADEEGKRIAARPRHEQGGDPREPRPAHRRPERRRSRVVVHHDGAHVPGAARSPRRPAPSCPIDDEHAAATAAQVGHRRSGWMSFQPLYDWITDQQPDLLEE